MTHRSCQTVGIDLGSTYSTLAFVDPHGTPRVVCDSSGQSALPSVVFFGDHEVIVGEMALKQARLREDRVVQYIKIHIGDPWRKEIDGHTHTPESISALILGQLVKDAAPQIGPITRAVITVPAHFTEKRRRATQQAGEIAGLRVVSTLNEPIAAALAYGLQHTNDEQIVMIYDLGGGTFDVTVVRASLNEIEELAINGNRSLGGRDWDQMLVDYVVDDFRKARGVDLRSDIQAMQDLLRECERAKMRLSQMQKTNIRFQFQGRWEHQVEMTRERFEQMTAHLLQATRLTTEAAVADARLSWEQISRIVLVGGSTLMPAVRRMIHHLSGKPPDVKIAPKLAVALGAATYGHFLETGRELRVPPPQGAKEDTHAPVARGLGLPEVPRSTIRPAACIRFVTAHGIGTKICTGTEWKNEVVISRNTAVPASVTRRFLADAMGGRGQQIKIDLTQGDTEDLAEVELLGSIHIEGLPANETEGRPLDVTMAFDEQGRLHVRAVYVPTGQQVQVSLDVSDGLRSEEVAQQRKFLQDTGFLKPVDAQELIQAMDVEPFNLADVTEDVEPVHSVDELLQALGIDPQEVPAIASEEERKGATASYVDENVQFTVFRPKTIPPEVWCPLLASAHLEEKRPSAPADAPAPREKAQAKATAALEAVPPEDVRETTQDSAQAIPQGGQITFVPQIEGMRFNPPQASVLWEEDEHTVEFRMWAPAILDGKVARGRMTAFLGAVIVADIPLKIEISGSATTREASRPVPESLTARPYRRIFASYSHRDLAIVEQFERYAEAIGDEYLRDWKHLRSGDRWSEKLLAMIDQADIFQLFWSSNSMRSEYVRREWEHALKRNQEGFIRPVYWEEPFPCTPPELPPPALAEFHFQRIGGGFGCHVPADARDSDTAVDQTIAMPRRPYCQEISRECKACVLFLLDQSFSMEAPLGDSGLRRCDGVVRAVNGWLENMVIQCTRDDGIRGYVDIGVLGYRTDEDANAIIEPALEGPLAGRSLVSITDIGNDPARLENVAVQFTDEETGKFLGMRRRMPIWFSSKALGGRPMCHALCRAVEILKEWIKDNEGSPPPVVIHISGGAPEDGDPMQYADGLERLATRQGNVRLFNCHVSASSANSLLFPATVEILPDELAWMLFGMSSVLPEPLYDRARADGLDLQPNARGMAFNADLLALARFLNIFTRSAMTGGDR